MFVAKGVDPEQPGLYVFNIEGTGTYVGQYSDPGRFLRQYSRNVRKLINKEPYRKGNPDGFRQIHRELAKAVRGRKRKISLTLIENWTEKKCATAGSAN